MVQTRIVKVSSLILAITFVFAVVLSGCATKKEENGAATTVEEKQTTAVEQTVKEELPFVKLSYYLGTPIPDESRQDDV